MRVSDAWLHHIVSTGGDKETNQPIPLALDLLDARAELERQRQVIDRIYGVVSEGIYGPPGDWHVSALVCIRTLIEAHRAKTGAIRALDGGKA